jgi:hypothetical protein
MPLKDELLLQRPNSGNLAIKDPHPRPSFSVRLSNKGAEGDGEMV